MVISWLLYHHGLLIQDLSQQVSVSATPAVMCCISSHWIIYSMTMLLYRLILVDVETSEVDVAIVLSLQTSELKVQENQFILAALSNLHVYHNWRKNRKYVRHNWQPSHWSVAIGGLMGTLNGLFAVSFYALAPSVVWDHTTIGHSSAFMPFFKAKIEAPSYLKVANFSEDQSILHVNVPFNCSPATQWRWSRATKESEHDISSNLLAGQLSSA